MLQAVFLSGCIAAQQVNDFTDGRQINDTKIIALAAPRTPWVAEIENRLRSKGFRILRYASITRNTVTQGNTTESFNASTARYILEIDGEAFLDRMNRCFGGGYKFNYINVSLIDTETNETLVNVSDAGYSEGCPPALSNMFENIANSIAAAWR